VLGGQVHAPGDRVLELVPEDLFHLKPTK
jgi:hypothetical protein